MEISTIGLDLAKSVFQVHAIDGAGEVVVRKTLRRAQVLPFFAKLPPCLVGMEACGTSHHWAREMIKLGHEVRLMPPAYVKPYVKRGKTDASDAEAICEAVTRPTMRFVPVKSPEQQAALALHRTRDLLVKQRTQLVNMIRGAAGRVRDRDGTRAAPCAGAGRAADGRRSGRGAAACTARSSRASARSDRCSAGAARKSREGAASLASLERALPAPGDDPGCGRDRALPRLPPSVSEPERFRSGRQFAASLGLTPLQQSSGGKERMGRISKMGDRYLRRLLVVGMTSLVRRARTAQPQSIRASRQCLSEDQHASSRWLRRTARRASPGRS